MRIAICDDDSQDLLQIALLVEAYRNSRKAHLVYPALTPRASCLLDKENYDVLFLDVLMPGIPGCARRRPVHAFGFIGRLFCVYRPVLL